MTSRCGELSTMNLGWRGADRASTSVAPPAAGSSVALRNRAAAPAFDGNAAASVITLANRIGAFGARRNMRWRVTGTMARTLCFAR